MFIVFTSSGEKMVTFAVDLLWVRVGKNGGTESFIRCILDGMHDIDIDFKVVLLVSRDNKNSFLHYNKDKRFTIYECPVYSSNIKGRVIWQNLHLRDTLMDIGITKCFEPVYSMPMVKTRGIEFYTVIHDLQAKHFPKYFSKTRCVWMDFSWRNTVNKSKKVVAISEYVKKDIIKHYKVESNKIVMIHNPISISYVDKERAIELVKEFGLEEDKFFFCVSSLLPHKNLQVLINMMRLRKDDIKLAIVGVGGPLEEEFRKQILEFGLESKICILPYVSEDIKNALYETCKLFLFPSTFEGFGMPPVEALLFDKTVITTRCASIPEVTKNTAVYVDNPRDENEWNDKIDRIDIYENMNKTISSSYNPYDKKKVVMQYIEMIMKQ
ncbi:MAG: glycosyltransferase family 4 protein [Butyrivibrio sp.]|jgi:glycosyltransferase involved in cell wall biosynthesis|nr:glycosyltransferase family 4 protein [Butyrivibrio sp.]